MNEMRYFYRVRINRMQSAFPPPSPIDFCGRVFGPEFDENGHRRVLTILRDEVERICPATLNSPMAYCHNVMPFSAVFFYEIAGSIFTKPMDTKIYRHSFEGDRYFFVSIGVSLEDLFLPKYRFRSVFLELILDATASLSQFAEKKTKCFDSESFSKCMTVACNRVLASSL